MTLAEVRKTVVAVLGAIMSIVPQVLATGAGLIPASVAMWLTVIAAVATSVLVYLVPNAPKDPLAKVQASVDALGPVVEMIRDRVQRDVVEKLGHLIPGPVPTSRFGPIQVFPGGHGGGGGGGGAARQRPDDPDGPDPFIVTPLRR